MGYIGLSYLIPAAISVASENYVSTLTTPSDSPDLLPTDDSNTLHVMKKGMPFKGRVLRGYCCSRSYFSLCFQEQYHIFILPR